MYFFAYAATNLDAGFSSIMNATTPLWGAVIGALFFNNRLSKLAIVGLFLGFLGVFVLSMDKLSWDFTDQIKGILAIICATSFYGLSANYSKQMLTGIKPLFIASGSLFGSALLMLPILIYNSFIPSSSGKTLGENFYDEVKEPEAQEKIRVILDALNTQ